MEFICVFLYAIFSFCTLFSFYFLLLIAIARPEWHIVVDLTTQRTIVELDPRPEGRIVDLDLRSERRVIVNHYPHP